MHRKQPNQWSWRQLIRVAAGGAWLYFNLAGQAVGGTDAPPATAGNRHNIVEDFSAETLDAGDVKIGTTLDYGLSPDLMIGTDIVAAALGASSIGAKWSAWGNGEHRVALGLRGAYLTKSTLFWGALGGIRDHFDTLDARVISPSIAWTNTLSPRLKLHTYWVKGFGKIRVSLSPQGRRQLWQAKHPGADYDARDPATQQPTDSTAPDASSSQNQAKSNKSSSPTQETIQVASVAGLAQEHFQLTGEFNRSNGNKVLVTTRIEQGAIEKLKTDVFRLTLAHQWIWTNFQMRLGIGTQYFVMSGQDLDSETADQSGWLPASDIAFYWRF